jgi:hypothetical protein
MTIDELLHAMTAGMTPSNDQIKDAAELLAFLASDEAGKLPVALLHLAVRGAAAEITDASTASLDLEAIGCRLIAYGQGCATHGRQLRALHRHLRAAQQAAA